MRVDADDFARPCSCGKEHHIDVKGILIESGAVEKLEEEMSEGELREYISPLLICDTNTCKATEEIMEDIYDRCQVLVLDADDLQADEHAVEIVENYMEEDIDLVLAVGSGAIHDISRYVAHKYRIPFVSVPTAASTDGFVSTMAAMIWNGSPKTVQAAAPVYVFADTDIFSGAPSELRADGVMDILGKYICLADWKIAHILNGRYYCEEVAELEQKAIRIVRDNLKDIADGDKDACEKLMYALMLSGIAMEMTRGSETVFGAEEYLLRNHPEAFKGKNMAEGLIQVVGELRQAAEKQDYLPEIVETIEELPSPDEMRKMLGMAGCISTSKRMKHK